MGRKKIMRYFGGLRRSQKRHLQMSADFVLIAASFVFAVILSGTPLSALAQPLLWGNLIIAASVTIAAFVHLGLYRALLRYITGASINTIVAGTGLGALVMSVLTALSSVDLSAALIAIYMMTAVLSIGMMRFGARAMIRKPALRGCIPVVVYGAGRAGQQLVAALNYGLEYRPVAFVDDDHRLHGTTINNVPVYPSSELQTLIETWEIREILLALPSLNRPRRRRIVARLEALGVEVKTIPTMNALISGRQHYTDLRPVAPEDMLGRDPVPPKPELMARNIRGKVVLVSGAGGTIGSELCRQIVAINPVALIMVDISEYALYAISTSLQDALGESGPALVPLIGSTQDAGRMAEILTRYKVETIYHAAAYKHVGLVEENPIEGINNNVFGTRTLVAAARAAGVRSFTLVSTDKTVRPQNIMGATKRLAEMICQMEARSQSDCIFSIVRFGNVLGSSGSVIPRFRDQIERGGPVTVTHPDVTRYFMTISEAAQLVIQASAMARGGDVFVLDMGEPVRILDLANSMIRQQGLVPFLVNSSAEMQLRSDAGDIAIQITGLKPGEKMHEELLIVNNPEGTEHPRIMSEKIPVPNPESLTKILASLQLAAERHDIPAAIALLQAAPIDYTPARSKAAEATGTLPESRREATTGHHLRLVVNTISTH
ncbi:MAG: polysaccharide biosynthesis protein [Rhodobacteraceae bacterium]|nr:MAG: polysaccharide biosynthesis protein [Paracoccaceae bacterium]